MDAVDHNINKPSTSSFTELTPEIEKTVDNIWNTGEPDDVLCQTSKKNILLRKDFITLKESNYLNDTIIDSYFDLICERSKKAGYPSAYAFNSFFFSTFLLKGYPAVSRWTKKIDIFNFDINFVPLLLGISHWCLAVIDHRAKKISYYDSRSGIHKDCLDFLCQYLVQELKDKKGETLDPNTYVKETMKNLPRQENGSDCGMFVLRFAECISRNAEMTFNQEDMDYFRRRTAYELLTNQIL